MHKKPIAFIQLIIIILLTDYTGKLVDFVQEGISLLQHRIVLGVAAIRRAGNNHARNLVNKAVKSSSGNEPG